MDLPVSISVEDDRLSPVMATVDTTNLQDKSASVSVSYSRADEQRGGQSHVVDLTITGRATLSCLEELVYGEDSDFSLRRRVIYWMARVGLASPTVEHTRPIEISDTSAATAEFVSCDTLSQTADEMELVIELTS